MARCRDERINLIISINNEGVRLVTGEREILFQSKAFLVSSKLKSF